MVRSQDVFERIEGYVDPPLAPLPAEGDLEALARHGFVKLSDASRRILQRGLSASGYRAFHATLAAGQLEPLLRSTNMRQGRVFGPAYSATVALADDGKRDPIERAACLLVAARGLADDVMHARLPQDVFKGQPLEMGEYPNLFATSLVVSGDQARLEKSANFDRIGVVVRRRFYVFDLPSSSPNVAVVKATLQALVADADREPGVAMHEAPGLLSAAAGTTLSAAMPQVRALPRNRASLDALRTCLLVLCLDREASPPDAAEAGLACQARNPANRWYFSSFQLVVFGNARACGIFSFPAYLDGNVMMRAAAELQRRAAGMSVHGPGEGLPFDRLAWSIDPKWIARARADVASIVDGQRATFILPDLGRDRFTRAGLDPVNAFVAGLALASHRRLGSLPPILQLVTVSKFRCVPVGAADVFTPEMRSFVEAFDRDTSGVARRKMLGAALDSQVRECRAERQGLNLRWTIEGFLRTRRGLARARAMAAFAATFAALRAVGAAGKRRIIVSHPEIFPELELVGRPGVRLPYVDPFALHYQMFADRVVVTFMPGLSWKVPNVVFSREIERALHDVVGVAEGA